MAGWAECDHVVVVVGAAVGDAASAGRGSAQYPQSRHADRAHRLLGVGPLASDVVANDVWDVPGPPVRRLDGPALYGSYCGSGCAACRSSSWWRAAWWALFRNFTNSVPHGDAVPSLAGATDLDGSAQNILLIGNDSRAGASKAELDALSHRARPADRQHRHDDDPARARRREAVDHLLPARLLGDHPGPRQGQAELGLQRRLQRGQEAPAQRAAGAERRDPADPVDAVRAHRAAHRPLHAGQPARLLPHQQRHRRRDGVPERRAEPEHRPRRLRQGLLGHRPAQGRLGDQGHAGAGVRATAARPALGDLDRIQRQQYFLGAAFRKVTSAGVLLNPFKLHDLLHAVGSSLLTDPASTCSRWRGPSSSCRLATSASRRCRTTGRS